MQQKEKQYSQMRIWTKTKDRLKVKSAKERKPMIVLVDEFSKQK
jgi:hypothetical protein